MTNHATPPADDDSRSPARESARDLVARFTMPAFAARFPDQVEQAVDVIEQRMLRDEVLCCA